MQKLDWLPLYIDELLSSPAYMDMTDSQFGWYMKLLLRSTRSERLGYLPLDGQLWRLAGARSREFFDRENARVMACFKIRQFDGLEWIYNQKLLSVMEDQSNKYRKRSSLISPVFSDVDFGKSTSKEKSKPKSVEEVKDYCLERANHVNPQQWFDYYSSNGWRVGRNPMRDWKAAVRTWEKNDFGAKDERNSAEKRRDSNLAVRERIRAEIIGSRSIDDSR